MMLILCGKSGSGKDTIAHRVLEKYPESAMRLVSDTSRPMREGELDGREYNFSSKEQFLKGIEDGKFIEYRSYNTLVDGIPDEWYYGTKKFDKVGDDKLLVAIKDLEGARVLKDYCEEIGEYCECVLIEVPDNVREERAKLRGSFNQTEWDRRLEADAIDFAEEKQIGVVDKIVKNDGTHTLDAIADFCYYAATTPVEELEEPFEQSEKELEEPSEYNEEEEDLLP